MQISWLEVFGFTHVFKDSEATTSGGALGGLRTLWMASIPVTSTSYLHQLTTPFNALGASICSQQGP